MNCIKLKKMLSFKNILKESKTVRNRAFSDFSIGSARSSATTLTLRLAFSWKCHRKLSCTQYAAYLTYGICM